MGVSLGIIGEAIQVIGGLIEANQVQILELGPDLKCRGEGPWIGTTSELQAFASAAH